MRTITLTAMLALSLTVSAQEAKSGLVVHEWGTFTAVYGADGTRMEWRPLETSDLPSFVYSRTSVAAPIPDQFEGKRIKVEQRMETPVLYFYTDQEMTADVTVGFPKGLITEWYPRVMNFSPPLGDGKQAVAVKNGLVHWGRFQIIPPTQAIDLPVEKSPSHYYPARETDSAYVRVCPRNDQQKGNEYEKFLFYRGVGNFDLPLGLKAHDGGRVTLTATTDLGRIYLFDVKADGSATRATLDSLRAGAEAGLALDGKYQPKAEFIQALSADLEKDLVGAGLYRKEALAMIKTWTDSYFETAGTRLLYLLPSKLTDELLPISITPAPRELKRVLVARVDIMTPGQSAELQRMVRDLGSDNLEIRDQAQKRIESFGRFAEPALEEAARTTTDPEIKARAREIIERFAVRR